jgi:malate dehydrogenase
MKISIISAGKTSLVAAYVIGLNSIFNEILLIDIRPEYLFAKSLDMEQVFILADKDITVKGSVDYNDVKNSDVIRITASVLTPVQENGNELAVMREAMAVENKKIITEIAQKLKAVIPTDDQQPLIIVLTNPLDIILSTFMRVGNFSKKKTIGSGNWLDTARLKFYLSR